MKNYLYSVLTVCTGGYEPVREIINPNPNVEYVCVTDDPKMTSKTWKIIYIPNIWFLYVKHHQYEFISTDVCLWLDGSYQIYNDPTEAFVKPFINSNKEFSISLHETRHSIIEEILNWVYVRKMSYKNAEQLIIRILRENLYKDCLFQTSCMLTKKTPAVLDIFYKVSELEADCSVDGKYRDDQTILSYVMVKHYYRWNGLNIMNFEKMVNNDYFKMLMHGKTDSFCLAKQLSFRCFDMDFDHLYEIGDDFNRDFFNK